MNSIPLALSEFSEESYSIHINSPMTKICRPANINVKEIFDNDPNLRSTEIIKTVELPVS